MQHQFPLLFFIGFGCGNGTRIHRRIIVNALVLVWFHFGSSLNPGLGLEIQFWPRCELFLLNYRMRSHLDFDLGLRRIMTRPYVRMPVDFPT